MGDVEREAACAQEAHDLGIGIPARKAAVRRHLIGALGLPLIGKVGIGPAGNIGRLDALLCQGALDAGAPPSGICLLYTSDAADEL